MSNKTTEEFAALAMKAHSEAQADLRQMKEAVKRSRKQDRQLREERLRLMRVSKFFKS